MGETESICRIDIEGGIDKLSMLLDHIYETQNPEICQLFPSQIDTMTYPLSIRDFKYIIANKKIECLQMCNKDLSVRHLKLLSPALAKNMPTILSIMDTDIGDEGVTVIADSVKGTTSLRHLAFINIGMTKVSCEVLGQALCCSKVQILIVYKNKLG